MNLTFLILGVFFSIAQVILIREYLVIFYGNEIFIGVAFASWFLWIGLGSLIFARLADRFKKSFDIFIILQFILPFAFLLQITGIRIIRSFIDVPSAEILPLATSMLITLFLTMPCSIIIGMLFPVGCRIAGEKENRKNHPISRIYIMETLGMVLGGMLFSFFFAARLSHITLALVLMILLMASVSINIIRTKKRNMTGYYKAFLGLSIFIGIIAIGIGITPLRRDITHFYNQLRWKSILPGIEFIESVNSRYQNVSIGRHGSQYSILGDGKFISSFPEKAEHEKFAAVLFAQKPSARNILLIGGGADGLLKELLYYPVEKIDYIEQDPKLFDLTIKYISPENRKAVEDRRVAVHLMDARYFVQSKARKEYYDMVVLRLPDPSSAFINRFYTLEFYHALKKILKPDGIVCTSVLSAENYLGVELANYSGSVYKTLKKVFIHIALAPGEQVWYFASSQKDIVSDNHIVLQKRYASISLKVKNFPKEGFRTVFPPERTGFIRNELEKSGAEINQDLRPITYYLNMLLWGSFSGSEWVKALDHIRSAGIGIYLIPIIIIILFRLLYILWYHHKEKEERFNSFLGVAVMGFVSMALQVILIFVYQSFFGYIYERIGIITALFMLGLAMGAGLTQALSHKIKKKDAYILSILLLSSIFVFSIPHFLHPSLQEFVFYVLFLISGFLTGALFPLAVGLYYQSIPRVGQTAGILDAADHGGAMIGALLSGALMVPLLGVEKSCRVLGTVTFLAGLTVLCSILSARRKNKDIEYLSFPFWKTSWIIAVITSIIFGLSFFIKQKIQEQPLLFNDQLLEEISGSKQFTYKEKPFPHYLGYRNTDSIDTISVNTFDIAGNISGYAGPINLLLSVSKTGSIKGVILLESQETPGYIVGIDNWLEKFSTEKLSQVYPVSRSDVDALTGATVTTDAIMAILNQSLFRIRSDILNQAPKIVKKPFSHSVQNIFKNYRLYIMLFLLAVSVWCYLRKGENARYAVMSLNLIFFGFFTNLIITLVNIGNISVGWLPGAGDMVWIVFAVIIIIISLLWGQVFCGYICPFGILQEFFSLFRMTKPPNSWLEQRTRYLKYIILAAALSLFWISGSSEWLSFNPMNFVFSQKFNTILIVFVVVILAGSMFFIRFWCRYFCPTGAFFSLFNKINILSFTAPKKIYSRCDMGVRGKGDIDCIRCNRCTFHKK